jgi:hypothetical protein
MPITIADQTFTINPVLDGNGTKVPVVTDPQVSPWDIQVIPPPPGDSMGYPRDVRLNFDKGFLDFDMQTDNNFYFYPTGGHGIVTYQVQAISGGETSNIATMTVIIPNLIPVAVGKNFRCVPDGSKDFTLVATDGNNDPLTYIIDTYPINGDLTGVAPDLNYVAHAGYTGPDSFTYHVNDGEADSNIAYCNIKVAENTNPLVIADMIYDSTDPYGFEIFLPTVDSDYDDLSYELITDPMGNVFQTSPTSFYYMGRPSIPSLYSFTVRAFDGELYSNEATVYINASVESTFRPFSLDGKAIRIGETYHVSSYPLAAYGQGRYPLIGIQPIYSDEYFSNRLIYKPSIGRNVQGKGPTCWSAIEVRYKSPVGNWTNKFRFENDGSNNFSKDIVFATDHAVKGFWTIDEIIVYNYDNGYIVVPTAKLFQSEGITVI